jgi:hypothetical protein
MHNICVQYTQILNAYRDERPVAYGALHASASLDTDPLVQALLVWSVERGLLASLDQFGVDVTFALQYQWNGAMEELGTGGALRSAAHVMQRLNDLRSDDVRSSEALLEAVFALKAAYLSHIGVDLRDLRCAVLRCHEWVPLDAVAFNSFRYCPRHVGLALFHGLRPGYNWKGVWQIIPS